MRVALFLDRVDGFLPRDAEGGQEAGDQGNDNRYAKDQGDLTDAEVEDTDGKIIFFPERRADHGADDARGNGTERKVDKRDHKAFHCKNAVYVTPARAYRA